MPICIATIARASLTREMLIRQDRLLRAAVLGAWSVSLWLGARKADTFRCGMTAHPGKAFSC